jgi:hypothetical protein
MHQNPLGEPQITLRGVAGCAQKRYASFIIASVIST